MGFFQDLKEDLSQAVNELLPEEVKMEEVDNVKSEDVKDLDGVDNQNLAQEFSNEAFSFEQINEEESKDSTEEAELNELALMLEKMEEMERQEQALSFDETKEIVEPKNMKEEGKGRMEDTNQKTVTDETAVITMGMTITGDISSSGSMDVIGSILGNIEVFGKLNVTGTIQGNSKAAEVFADSAKITGEITSEGSVKIGQSSVVIGNITANSAVIAGAVKGDIDVRGPVILDTSAIVMGNIKSKSVQINNGAVIEGLCSQCYADVNPTAFFEDIKKKNNKK
jgi:cytoskeletal protein CcmA (bactofilin family)